MNEVAPLTAVQDQIKDRIKAEFASLIPDKMWESMVRSVVADFLNEDRYIDGVKTSPIKALIRDALNQEAKSQISARMEALAPQWDGYGQMVASEAIKKLIDEHFDDLLRAVQKGMVEAATTSAINSIRTSMSQF